MLVCMLELKVERCAARSRLSGRGLSGLPVLDQASDCWFVPVAGVRWASLLYNSYATPAERLDAEVAGGA
jgi:hypothetical protein